MLQVATFTPEVLLAAVCIHKLVIKIAQPVCVLWLKQVFLLQSLIYCEQNIKLLNLFSNLVFFCLVEKLDEYARFLD